MAFTSAPTFLPDCPSRSPNIKPDPSYTSTSNMSPRYELPLLKDLPSKTIDFGADGLACSLSTHGRIISIAQFHPLHGQIIVEPFAQFSSEHHYDQQHVRKYRYRAMDVHNDPSFGFGLAVSGVER